MQRLRLLTGSAYKLFCCSFSDKKNFDDDKEAEAVEIGQVGVLNKVFNGETRGIKTVAGILFSNRRKDMT